MLRVNGTLLAVVPALATRPVRPAHAGSGTYAFWLVKLLVTPVAARVGSVTRYAPAELRRLVDRGGFELLDCLEVGTATEILARAVPPSRRASYELKVSR